MDRKSIIILVVSLLVLIAWYPITNKIFPPKPAPIRSTNLVSRTTTTNQLSSTNRVEPRLAALTNSAPSTNILSREERTVTLENDDARYVFTSIGGGLKIVDLKRFPAAVDCSAKKSPTNKAVTLN